jgi:predicted enzyme related to lactoylglutathione lyase
MPGIIHFEINADDPKRAAEFYKKVFGWTISMWEGSVKYWLVSTSNSDKPGINGAIMERMEKGAITIFVDVPSVDEFLKKIAQAGGKALTAKMAILGVGYSAYCMDTEGNLFGLFQGDPSAK